MLELGCQIELAGRVVWVGWVECNETQLEALNALGFALPNPARKFNLTPFPLSWEARASEARVTRLELGYQIKAAGIKKGGFGAPFLVLAFVGSITLGFYAFGKSDPRSMRFTLFSTSYGSMALGCQIELAGRVVWVGWVEWNETQLEALNAGFRVAQPSP